MSAPRPQPSRPAVLLLGLSLLAPSLPALSPPPLPPVAVDDQTDEHAELARRLAEALERVESLEQRLAELENERRQRGEEDDLEAQLQALIEPEPEGPTTRTIFPSAFNPRIGVFMDATVEAGDYEEKLGDDEGDRFSLRETEIDFRLPVSPFAEGVLVTVFEDAGSGEFESSIEEGYASIALGALLDRDITTTARVGRFRVPFGRDNKLHTHDLLQVDRPWAVTQQLGEEGLIGDGVEFTQPLYHSGAEPGTGRTTTLSAALVNGEMFTGEEALLGGLADEAGLTLDSDAPVVVARLSHFLEVDPLSDLEFGASYLTNVGSKAVQSDAGTKIEPSFYGLDATWRQRDAESGVGSWLVGGEWVRTDVDYDGPVSPDFPSGSEQTRGWWLTAQRQTSPSLYLGLRYGQSDVLGTDEDIRDISPYVSWYADEFFRVRLQGQQLDVDGADDERVRRVLLQLTWNFGAHLPHPYWVNR